VVLHEGSTEVLDDGSSRRFLASASSGTIVENLRRTTMKNPR
jgi:hypothetical protein